MIYDVLSLLVAIWIAEFLLLAILLVVLAWRDEQPTWPAVPDFVPDEWTGGDRTQTKPAREPHR